MSITEHVRFQLKTLDDLRAELSRLGLSLPIDEETSLLGDQVEVDGVAIPNRLLIHPMEGFDADANGVPGELAFRRYQRYAAGGSGLIWFEATTPWERARSNPRQFWLHEGSVDGFARLVEATKKAARNPAGKPPVCVLQMTHSGRYSKPHGTPVPIIGHHSPILDPLMDLPPDYPLIPDEELDRLLDAWVEQAKLAKRAGFDGVDIKACHRYLCSEMLASHKRAGRYGGSFENRTRLLREALARIRAAVPELLLTTRLSAYDAIDYPYGWGVDREDHDKPDLTEPLRLIGLLRDDGLRLLNISIGNPYYNPHYGRPYDFPIEGFQTPEEHPLYGVVRFIRITKAIQEAYPEMLVCGSGYAWLRHLMPAVAAGVVKAGWAALIGQGRGAFAYPESVNDLLETGAMDPRKVCVACSKCTQIMRDGGQTGCVIRDAGYYAAEYRDGRRRASDET